jgi:hypothetical protein
MIMAAGAEVRFRGTVKRAGKLRKGDSLVDRKCFDLNALLFWDFKVFG